MTTTPSEVEGFCHTCQGPIWDVQTHIEWHNNTHSPGWPADVEPYEPGQKEPTPSLSDPCLGEIGLHELESHGPWFKLTVLCRRCGYVLTESEREKAFEALR